MTSYKKITNVNYMNTCECKELKQKLELINNKIICIEYDNDELKQENKELKLEIKELKQENKELKLENIELKLEIKELKKEIVILKDKNQKLEFDKLKIKIITALQDLNAYDKLEIKFNHPFKSCINKLRYNRNHINHYININDDSEILINIKIKFLLLQLNNLSQDNITILNNRYSHNSAYCMFIEEIIKYLESQIKYNNDLITDDELEEIEFWWLD
jgi:chromosome segregation ATPase